MKKLNIPSMFVLNSRYQLANYEPEENLMIFRWNDLTIEMSDSEFLDELKTVANFLAKYRPERVLVVTAQLYIVLSGQMMHKLNEILIPAYNSSGVRNVAIVVPEELFRKISIEQAVEMDKEKHNFDVKFFDDEQQARQWLDTLDIAEQAMSK